MSYDDVIFGGSPRFVNPITTYEIDECGVVQLYCQDGSWGGMCTQESLKLLLK